MSDSTRWTFVPATRLYAVVVLMLGIVGLTSSARSLSDGGAAVLPVTALVLSVVVTVLGVWGLATARRNR